jgi:hypothetical protein
VTKKVPRRSIFFVAFSLLVMLVVGIGFVPTLDQKLIHPTSPRPTVLYLHAALFTAWVLLFVVQTILVRVRSIRWHRRLGMLGVGFGILIPLLGLSTALAIARIDIAAGKPNVERGLIIPVFDMTAFSVLFASAILLRSRPDYHRRLMLMACAGLTVAAFARFPSWMVPDDFLYLGVDVLIVIAVARDWLATRRVHAVYRYGLPALIVGQALAMWISLKGFPPW